MGLRFVAWRKQLALKLSALGQKKRVKNPSFFDNGWVGEGELYRFLDNPFPIRVQTSGVASG